MSGGRRKPSWVAPGSDPGRRAPSLEPKATLHVFCEGEKTEIGWLEFLEERARRLNMEVEPSGGDGVPSTVVHKALGKRASLKREGRKNPAVKNDEVWVVIDRDDHDLSAAIVEAKKHGIGVVFSNECFELWPLLHFTEYTSAGSQGRKALQHELKRHHPVYDHDAGAVVTWSTLGSSTSATERAIRLHLASPDATTWTGTKGQTDQPRGALRNPSTTAWLLDWRCDGFPELKALKDAAKDAANRTVMQEVLGLVAEPSRKRAIAAIAVKTPAKT